MKILFTGLTLLFISTTCIAQLDQGTWIFGGSGSFNSYNEKSTFLESTNERKYNSMDLSGSIGYFVLDKMALGLRPGFSFLKGKSYIDDSEVAAHTKIGVGPFTRYYILEQDNQFNLLADLSYQIGYMKYPTRYGSSGHFNNLRILAGAEFFFNSSVGLELLLGYSKTYETLNKPSTSYSLNRAGFLASVGFQLHLERK